MYKAVLFTIALFVVIMGLYTTSIPAFTESLKDLEGISFSAMIHSVMGMMVVAGFLIVVQRLLWPYKKTVLAFGWYLTSILAGVFNMSVFPSCVRNGLIMNSAHYAVEVTSFLAAAQLIALVIGMICTVYVIIKE